MNRHVTGRQTDRHVTGREKQTGHKHADRDVTRNQTNMLRLTFSDYGYVTKADRHVTSNLAQTCYEHANIGMLLAGG